MVIYASAKFADRLRCAVSLPDHRPVQRVKLDCWNGDIFSSSAGQCALMMNDASLSMVVIPLKGITAWDQFLGVFLPRAARLFADAGGSFETRNQTIIVLRRSDRQLIGTMNQAREEARFAIEVALDEIDWNKLEDRLNAMPFSVMDYSSPKEELPWMLTSPLY